MRHLWLSLTLASLFSCSATTTVGKACTSRAECAYGERCTEQAGGLCSRRCQLPKDAPGVAEYPEIKSMCPDTAACIAYTSTVAICSPRCVLDSQCRRGFFCAPTFAGSTQRACRPGVGPGAS